jgi:DUF1680 family protein
LLFEKIGLYYLLKEGLRMASILSRTSVFALIFITAGMLSPAQAGPQVINPFPLNSVRLLPGTPWHIAFNNKVYSWLKKVDADNVLYIWRQQYGLPTPGTPMGSWEAPTSNLRGHFTGHILSSLAMTYGLTADTAILNKAQYIIRCLDTCQGLAAGLGMSAGCLSAYGEQQFINLENGQAYPSGCWAPWYTQHKVISGLIKCYQEIGDTLALHVAEEMATWACNRLSVVPYATLQNMWSRYIAGEYGGYNESAGELYLITGDTAYRSLALFFNDNSTSCASLTNMVNNTDAIAGCSPHEYIASVSGYLRVYDAIDSARYYTACSNFFNMVYFHHRFRNGGINYYPSGNDGFITRDGEATSYTGTGNALETCVSYTMMGLARSMFYHETLSSTYMDYTELVSFNHLLRIFGVALWPNDDTRWSRYATPVCHNMDSSVSSMSYSGSSATCCEGASMECPERFAENIYGCRGDTLYINTFMASSLDWTAKGMTLTMDTKFPECDTVKLTITGTGTMPIKVRAGWWKRRPWTITIDGVPMNAVTGSANSWEIAPASFFMLPVTNWNGIHTVKIVAAQSLRFEPAVGALATGIGAIMFGPLVLTSPGQSGTRTITTTGTNTRAFATSASWTLGGTAMTPQYRVTTNYNTYNNVSSVPASWSDTLWETAVSVTNPVVPVAGLAAPIVKIQKLRITVSFASAILTDQNLRLQIFNMQGEKVAELGKMLRKGERSAIFSRPNTLFPAGLYICSVTAGNRNCRVTLVCGK